MFEYPIAIRVFERQEIRNIGMDTFKNEAYGKNRQILSFITFNDFSNQNS